MVSEFFVSKTFRAMYNLSVYQSGSKIGTQVKCIASVNDICLGLS